MRSEKDTQTNAYPASTSNGHGNSSANRVTFAEANSNSDFNAETSTNPDTRANSVAKYSTFTFSNTNSFCNVIPDFYTHAVTNVNSGVNQGCAARQLQAASYGSVPERIGIDSEQSRCQRIQVAFDVGNA
jgi:hypothetical protein